MKLFGVWIVVWSLDMLMASKMDFMKIFG